MKQDDSPRMLLFRSISAWDRKHRIVGKTPVEQLYAESLEALQDLRAQVSTLVDLGAGSGILAWPWLLEGLGERVVFVESDLKKVAFLEFFKSEVLSLDPGLKDRILIVGQPYQNVSRETVEAFAANKPYALVARAFSGALDLTQAHRLSAFKDQALFCFETQEGFAPKKFVLKPILVST